MGARAFGETGALALPRESYKLALTRDLLQRVFTGTTHLPAALSALAEQAAGGPVSGYRRGDSLFTDNPVSTAPLDQQYWIASGVAGFATDAAAHFYLPERYTDPFGNVTALEYDPLDLFVRSSRDAMGNESVVERFDYRVLAPLEMLDPNGNRAEVYFDALGLVVAAAAKGKRAGNGWEGDDLEGFDAALANPPAADVQDFCTDSVLNLRQARDWLGHATSRFVYHFGDATRMAGACGIVRERAQGPGERAPGFAGMLRRRRQCADEEGAGRARPGDRGGTLDRQRPDRAQQQGQAGQAVRTGFQRAVRLRAAAGERRDHRAVLRRRGARGARGNAGWYVQPGRVLALACA